MNLLDSKINPNNKRIIVQNIYTTPNYSQYDYAGQICNSDNVRDNIFSMRLFGYDVICPFHFYK